LLSLLGAASRYSRFSPWAGHAEKIAAERNVKLDAYLMVLYCLLEDLVLLRNGRDGIRNADIREKLTPLAQAVSFEWLERAVKRTDELMRLVRRNIQKSIALDALVLELRG
jgi:DNA polymerase-3 subunit delta'